MKRALTFASMLLLAACADGIDQVTAPMSEHDIRRRANGFAEGSGPLLGNLTNYLFVFTDGSIDANWQGASKGFSGNVAVSALADQRTSGTVPFAGTIFTNASVLGAWQSIVAHNTGASAVTSSPIVSALQSDLASAFSAINQLSVSPGYADRSAISLNGLNTTDGVNQQLVINVTSGFHVSSKINICGDAGDVYVLRWDSDKNFTNGYQGQVKFQSGGGIVPCGALTSANFVHVAGDIASSGGGSNPPLPYPQGPNVSGGSNWNGGGFFTGYWLTTGDPATGQTSSLSNAIFVGGWYTTSSKVSLTSGTSGIHVSTAPAAIMIESGENQTALTNSRVSTAPAVRVVDVYGHAMPNVAVSFAIGDGNGSLTGGSTQTDANGIATVGSWTLGAAGSNSLVATATGSGISGNPAIIHAVALIPTVHAINISPVDPAPISVGSTIQLQAAVTADPGANEAITWTSSDPAVTVSANGLATGASAGNSTVCAVSVAAPAVFGCTSVTILSGSGWTVLANMPTAREWVSATSNGQHLFALGGWMGTNLTANEMFDHSTQAWSVLPSMPEARYAGTGAQAIGGKIYMAGGVASYPNTTGSLFVYNIATAEWSIGPSAPMTMGCGASAASGSDLFVFSGCHSSFVYDNSLYKFDTMLAQWTTLAAAPNKHLYPSAVFAGGKLYVISGISDESNTLTGTVDVFDPGSGTWSSVAPLPTPRFLTSAVAIGSKIYVIGGNTSVSGSPSSVVEVFDVVTQTWTTAPSMPTARWGAAAAVVGGRIVVVGGTMNGLSWLSTAEAYQP